MNIISNSKLSIRERYLIKLIGRQFSQSECCQNNYRGRDAKMFNKLMGVTGHKKKRHYVDTDIGSTPSLQKLVALGGKNKVNKENSRRVHVLNKLFMRNITDLMVTGQLSADLFGRGLEISRVAVAPDFNKVNVYWLVNENENDTSIEKLLFDVSMSLRHELSQLRIMGVVPRIEFVKDKHYEQVIKVERLLNRLDFSEDVEVPTHPIDHPKEESMSETIELHMETENKDAHKECTDINEMNQESNEDVQKIVLSERQIQTEDETPLPPMEHTTFNLYHEKIMNRIKTAVVKSKALHRRDPNVAPPPPPSSAEPLLDVNSDGMSEKARREELAKFLLQRKILREKALKKEQKYGPAVQLPAQNVEIELPHEFEMYNETHMSEQDYDYIEEEVTDERSNR